MHDGVQGVLTVFPRLGFAFSLRVPWGLGWRCASSTLSFAYMGSLNSSFIHIHTRGAFLGKGGQTSIPVAEGRLGLARGFQAEVRTEEKLGSYVLLEIRPGPGREVVSVVVTLNETSRRTVEDVTSGVGGEDAQGKAECQ